MLDRPGRHYYPITGATDASDVTKRASEADESHHAADKIEELPEKEISDRDAESIKGGRARGLADEAPKE